MFNKVKYFGLWPFDYNVCTSRAKNLKNEIFFVILLHSDKRNLPLSIPAIEKRQMKMLGADNIIAQCCFIYEFSKNSENWSQSSTSLVLLWRHFSLTFYCFSKISKSCPSWNIYLIFWKNIEVWISHPISLNTLKCRLSWLAGPGSDCWLMLVPFQMFCSATIHFCVSHPPPLNINMMAGSF